jgi:hypothetical protein
MVIPFKLELREFKNTPIPITNFVTDESQIYQMDEKQFICVRENVDLSVRFKCDDPNAKLYMDGLDTLPARSVQQDEKGDIYISPSNEEIYLYKQNNRNQSTDDKEDYYPLVPGNYQIRVELDGQIYYSWFKVKPKQMTEEEWEVMKNEIEETLRGLAQELIGKNSSISFYKNSPIPITVLRKLIIIKRDYYKWIQALQQICDNPRIQIKKEYSLIPTEKNPLIDEKTIRYHLRHPESKNHLYAPKHTRKYDLLENRWIRYILNFLIKEMTDALQYIVKYKEKAQKELEAEERYYSDDNIRVIRKKKALFELKEFEEFAKRVRNECYRILQVPWMDEVKNEKPVHIPHVMGLDQRYRTMYQLYRSLKNDDVSVVWDKQYQYYWKRTDLLYEIWGHIKLIQALRSERVGFKVEKGWIFDNDSSSSVKVPFLEPGTVIHFRKGDIKIHLLYDSSLPFNSKETSSENPVYTGSTHNRPDSRIDIFYMDDYVGSIVVDYKNRPLIYIWDSRKGGNHYRTDTMNQLDSYKSSIRSKMVCIKKNPSNSEKVVHPVEEVWAVYPRNYKNPKMESPLEDYGIRLVELSPKDDMKNFEEQLNEVIEKVINKYYSY